MPTLTLIRGLPGSGKSTVARAMMLDGFVHVEADMFFEDEYDNYRFDAARIGEAHEWCQEMTEEFMEVGLDVVVSNTFTRKWEMEPYMKLADKYDYTVVIRTEKGEYPNIHNVPQEVIDRMKARWED